MGIMAIAVTMDEPTVGVSPEVFTVSSPASTEVEIIIPTGSMDHPHRLDEGLQRPWPKCVGMKGRDCVRYIELIQWAYPSTLSLMVIL